MLMFIIEWEVNFFLKTVSMFDTNKAPVTSTWNCKHFLLNCNSFRSLACYFTNAAIGYEPKDSRVSSQGIFKGYDSFYWDLTFLCG